LPQLIGVLPNYKEINNLKVVAGRFFVRGLLAGSVKG